MRAKSYKVIETESEELSRVQTYVAQAIESLAASAILDGILIKNVQLASGTNSVQHKLNRALRGYLIIRKRSNVDIWDSQDSNSNPSKTLNLEASATVNVDLYVF